MLDQFYLESIDQIKAIAEPTRWRILSLLITSAMTGSQLARVLNIPRQRAHYHMKTLERVGLIEFKEKIVRNSVVEKYYRAIARQYRTDQIVARGRQLPEKNEIALETVEAMSELTRAMMELAKADVVQPDHFGTLLRYGYNYQEDYYLTPDQIHEVKENIRKYNDHLANLSSQNRAESSEKELVHIRYTLLITPAAALDLNFEAEEVNSSLSIL